MPPITILRFLEMPTKGKKVHFHYHRIKFAFRTRPSLELFILKFFKYQRIALRELNVIFCTDEFLLQLNRQHLGHNYYTDILTFNLADHPTKEILGEIYISIDRVRKNSHTFKTSFRDELIRVIFHGILHLLGLEDRTSGQKMTMQSKENELLIRYKQFEKVPRETFPKQ